MSGPPFPPPPDPYAQAYAVEPPRTGLAVASLVLGIIAIPTAFVCVGPLLGIIAIIMGIVAVVRASGDPMRHGGKGLAIGGIVTGVLSIILVVVMLVAAAPMFGKVMGIGQTAMQFQELARALQTYHSAHSEYPPDLPTLAANVPLQCISLSATAAPTGALEGIYYVPGVDTSDPPDWILAYSSIGFMNQQLYFVVYSDGVAQDEPLDGATFQQELARFKQEYEADRGEPPTILPPVGGAASTGAVVDDGSDEAVDDAESEGAAEAGDDSAESGDETP